MCGFRLAFLALAHILTPSSLSAQPVARQPTVEALPDVTLPPGLNRVLRDYERAWQENDAVELASLFAEDGFVLQSNAPPIRGRSAIRAAYEGKGGAPLRLRSLAFAAGSTDGYIIGEYRYGKQSSDVGKFTLTLRRKPGERWLIFSDMDNSNMPHRNSSNTSQAVVRQVAGNRD